MKWSTLYISQNVLLPCFAYAAVLLPTAKIIYIGGIEKQLLIPPRLVDIKMVRLFDTKSFTCSTKQTTGANIVSRAGHAAILTQNDINTWEWSIPKIPQKDAPPSLTLHSATIFENYMIISFGLIVSQLSQQGAAALDNIYILDIRNYTWITVATINNLESIPVPINPSLSTPTLIIVVTSVAA
ncbi:galactose oxidase [Gigaspora margarita]|uniref:Galactose oxidase n=1 Tax=Gigaspora margarita TaxID=4874 RepID=A0A8H4AW74_GIGMA|nr:galactose oxidase [Gigaspora margarita]